MDDASIPDPSSTTAADPPQFDQAPAPVTTVARPDSDRLAFVPPRVRGGPGTWLHVVKGSTVPAASRAVFELAARFLAGGQRVLLVDGSPRLRLCERFDRGSQPGLNEWLATGAPVLELVQVTGRLGLYLMSHGSPTSATPWSQLGRALAAARPYFGRIILAFDGAIPDGVIGTLAGQPLEAWRPREEGPGLNHEAFEAGLGIHCSDLDLDAMLIPRLEALETRVWMLLTALREGIDATPSTPDHDPAVAAPPQALDCDLRVGERLRFLLWSRGGESSPPAPDPSREA